MSFGYHWVPERKKNLTLVYVHLYRVTIPVVVAISEHHLHTRGLVRTIKRIILSILQTTFACTIDMTYPDTQVKIAFTFDGSSTASFNSSADSNLIFLRLGFFQLFKA